MIISMDGLFFTIERIFRFYENCTVRQIIIQRKTKLKTYISKLTKFLYKTHKILKSTSFKKIIILQNGWPPRNGLFKVVFLSDVDFNMPHSFVLRNF